MSLGFEFRRVLVEIVRTSNQYYRGVWGIRHKKHVNFYVRTISRMVGLALGQTLGPPQPCLRPPSLPLRYRYKVLILGRAPLDGPPESDMRLHATVIKYDGEALSVPMLDEVVAYFGQFGVIRISQEGDVFLESDKPIKFNPVFEESLPQWMKKVGTLPEPPEKE